MDYNKIYKKNSSVWGQEPNKLLQMIWQKAEPGSFFLDLGAGQGRDSIFMAQKGFNVVAVDESIEGIKIIQKFIDENKISNLQVINQSIKDYKIEKDKFSIINAYNIFQFLAKKDALKILEEIKKNIQPGGYIIISGFTIEDPSYSKNKNRGYFEHNELLKILKKFELIFNKELVVEDTGHAGVEVPHKHGVVRLIAKKK